MIVNGAERRSQPIHAYATVEYHAAPPSLNATAMRQHWSRTRRLKREWQNDLGLLLLAAKFPRSLEHVTARAVLQFPTLRRRDAGNFSWLVEKALGDALTEGGWLSDDTHDRFSFTGVDFVDERGPALTVIKLVGVRSRARGVEL